MENRQIKNIAEPTDYNDAVSKKTLDSRMEHHREFITKSLSQAMQYVEKRHMNTIEAVVSKQKDISDLIVTQEGKVRDLINFRCDVIEKEYKQLKITLQADITTIKQDLYKLDQHMQGLASLHFPNATDQANILHDTLIQKHKVAKKNLQPNTRNAESSEKDPDYW